MSNRFMLTIIDDDHLILTTESVVPPDMQSAITRAFSEWREKGGAIFLSDMKVNDMRYAEIELDLGHQERPPSSAEIRHERRLVGLPDDSSDPQTPATVADGTVGMRSPTTRGSR